MNSNVFSISPQIVVSEQRFYTLNNWLEEQGFRVEKVPYYEIGKQEGLLRCSTLPLIREQMTQSTNCILMVRPAAFRANEETAVNNYFQDTESVEKNSNLLARAEFDNTVNT